MFTQLLFVVLAEILHEHANEFLVRNLSELRMSLGAEFE